MLPAARVEDSGLNLRPQLSTMYLWGNFRNNCGKKSSGSIPTGAQLARSARAQLQILAAHAVGHAPESPIYRRLISFRN